MCTVAMLITDFYSHRRSTFKGLLQPFIIVDLLLYLVKIKLFQTLVVIIFALKTNWTILCEVFLSYLRSGRMIRIKKFSLEKCYITNYYEHMW